jgi:hypothetical protein
VTGDTPVEITYSDYRDFGGTLFPGRIVRTQGGYPVLDLTVSSVTARAPVDIAVPEPVRSFKPAPIVVQVDKLAPGVFYMRGGSHHSVAIDQRDHVIVVEDHRTKRAQAVIARSGHPQQADSVSRQHVHFDHSAARTCITEAPPSSRTR